MAKNVDRLKLLRVQPVQGRPVEVRVLWNDAPVGWLELPFTGWLKFKKLLEAGLEQDARADHALQLKLSIAGMQADGPPAPTAQAPEYRGGVSNLAAEDEEDAADLQAIAAAEAGALPPTNSLPEGEPGEVTQGLIRSLRKEER